MTCASFSFDSDFVLGENIPQDKAYFIEGDDGIDYIDSQQNPNGLPFYSDVTIYSCDLSDFEEIFEDIYDTYGSVSEYYSNSPNNLLTLIGTLEYPNGTLTENCQSQEEEVTWTINNKLVDTITINNKEVKSIVSTDGTILYEKLSDGRIATQMVFQSTTGTIDTYRLQDINGNNLGGKSIVEYYDVGDINIVITSPSTRRLGIFTIPNTVVRAVFEGDATYKGCEFIRS